VQIRYNKPSTKTIDVQMGQTRRAARRTTLTRWRSVSVDTTRWWAVSGPQSQHAVPTRTRHEKVAHLNTKVAQVYFGLPAYFTASPTSPTNPMYINEHPTLHLSFSSFLSSPPPAWQACLATRTRPTACRQQASYAATPVSS
jgi:hypothetical protein